jgi:hypothetical protein
MHGTGTVRGLQLVAFIASNTCCALASEMQPRHQDRIGQRIHLSRSRSQLSGQGGSRGISGRGKGNGGPSGPGV